MTTETWPGYTPEAQAYEMATRKPHAGHDPNSGPGSDQCVVCGEYAAAVQTGLNLNLNAVEGIRLHGLITERIERDRKKLALLAELRAGIIDEPDVSELMVADAIRDFDRVLDRLSIILYGETP